MHYLVTVSILLILKYVIYMCTLLPKAAYVVTSFINLYNKHSTYSLCIRRGHTVETFLKKNPVDTWRRFNVDTTSHQSWNDVVYLQGNKANMAQSYSFDNWDKTIIILLVINNKHICYLYLENDIFLIFLKKDLQNK